MIQAHHVLAAALLALSCSVLASGILVAQSIDRLHLPAVLVK